MGWRGKPLRRHQLAQLHHSDGLAGNIIYSIAQEPNGVMWFGTSGGVSRYDGKTWHNYTKETGLLENHVYALAVAPNGTSGPAPARRDSHRPMSTGSKISTGH